MPSDDLKNKPLVEAILEIKWKLQAGPAPGTELDPHYAFLLGLFHDKVKADYPHHEALPTSSVPEELVPHMAGHRFRVAPDGWPLIQLGPGVLTVNETSGYTWAGFEPRCRAAVSTLFSVHPSPKALLVSSVALRYIDAVKFDFQNANVLDFLRTKLKTNIALPPELFHGNNISRIPSGFNWQIAFPHNRPKGSLTLRFATGLREDAPVLVLETLVVSQDDEVPSLPDGVADWLTQAHDIAHDTFFKLIEGDLEKEFSGG